ncbi:MAG: hypothetical protein ABL995_10455 [Bryobacteraceae bacterium]
MLLHLILIAFFGVYLPWMKGLEFLDPPMISAYACLGALFAGPSAGQAFSGGGPRRDGTPSTRPQTMNEAGKRIVRALSYGEALIAIFLAAGILTVNFQRPGHWLLPQLDTLAEVVILGLAASVTVVTAVAWLSLRYSEKAARFGMRFLFLVMLLSYYYGSLRIAEYALPGTLLCSMAAVGFFYLLRREVIPQ